MRSKLVYKGYNAVHSLGVTWNQNQELGIEDLFKVFETRARTEGIDKPTRRFADWVFEKYLSKLGAGFEFHIDENDFVNDPLFEPTVEDQIESFPGITPAESTPAQEFSSNAPTPTSPVTVESSDLKASASLEEAQQKLKKMQHPDAVGTIERHPPQDLSPNDMAAFARNAPPPGSQVMSGDDLSKSKALNSSMGTTAHVLAPAGENSVEAVKVPAVSRESVEKAHNEMATANRGSRVLVPDEIQPDGSRVSVISGDHFSDQGQATKNIVNSAPTAETTETASEPAAPKAPRRNENFQGFQGMSSGQDISIDSIFRNPDPHKQRELISACKSSRTLKATRNLFRRSGNQKMVDAIDQRLLQLPPVNN